MQTCGHCGADIAAPIADMTRRLLAGMTEPQQAAYRTLTDSAAPADTMCWDCFSSTTAAVNAHVLAGGKAHG